VAVEIPTSSSREVTAVGVFWLKIEVPEKVFSGSQFCIACPGDPQKFFTLYIASAKYRQALWLLPSLFGSYWNK
jgi:hypothetical protein